MKTNRAIIACEVVKKYYEEVAPYQSLDRKDVVKVVMPTVGTSLIESLRRAGFRAIMFGTGEKYSFDINLYIEELEWKA